MGKLAGGGGLGTSSTLKDAFEVFFSYFSSFELLFSVVDGLWYLRHLFDICDI